MSREKNVSFRSFYPGATMMIRYLLVSLVFPILSSASTPGSINDTGVRYKFVDSNYDLVDVKDYRIPQNKSLIVFAHGFRCSTKTGIVQNFGKSIAQLTDSNVVLVDWSKWTKNLDYTNIVQQLPTIAPYLVDWLNGLRDNSIINSFDDVTLIGHSLGAHLVGYTGNRLNGSVNKVIALDPAQPNFKGNQKNERVNENSGQFVMVLHTSTVLLGLREPTGHVDFYFNGGQLQPSCYSDTVCGHMIVLSYLEDSFKNSSTFKAFRCRTLEDCEKKIVDNSQPPIYMNADIPASTRGLYSIVPEKKEIRLSRLYSFF